LFVIEPNEPVSINSIIESRYVIFDENIFSSVPRPSLRIPNGTGKISDSWVLEEVTEEEQGMRSLTNTPIALMLRMIPRHFDEAMKSHDVAFLKEAINDEMDSIMGNNTWVLADLPLCCKWIYKKTEVARISTIRLLIAMTSIHNLIIHQMDVKTTFLNESEFVALAAAGKEAEWLEKLLLEIPLWSKPIAHISIRCDSAATLAKAYSQMYNGKSRHLGVRHSMIREPITNGVVSIEFVRSQQNLADHLTKGLARDLVLKSAEGMRLKMCLEPAEKEDEVVNFLMVNFFEKVLSRSMNKEKQPMDGLIPAFDMDIEKCKTCMLTKIAKKPFQNVKRETKVLELIHSDLCDLHATPSLGNKKYFVTFIDDVSRSQDVALFGKKNLMMEMEFHLVATTLGVADLTSRTWGRADVYPNGIDYKIEVSTPMDTSEKLMPNNGQALVIST
ncbi:hypothetical protein Tco_0693620, partial [Tanacetum coccineum]